MRTCSIESISIGFLSSVRANDAESWERLLNLYSPVVYRWCARSGMTASDAEDVGQEVFHAVAKGLSGFRRDAAEGSFVAWLRTIARFKIADFWRSHKARPRAIGGSDFQQSIQRLPFHEKDKESDSFADVESELSDESLVISRALSLVKQKFQQKTWTAFWETAVKGRATKDVAADLNMSEMAVRQSKSRVLRQLRKICQVCEGETNQNLST